MNKHLWLFLALLVSMAGVFTGTDYYVDPTSGNDCYNGTSPSTAWRTIGQVNNSMPIFGPGDRVLFKRGETFTGSSLIIRKGGTSSNPLVFGAYGIGNKPLFSGYSSDTVIYTHTAGLVGVALEDIAIRGVSGLGHFGVGFTADNNSAIRISRVDVDNVGHIGICVMCATDYLVEDCVVSNCGNAGIAIIGDQKYPAANGIVRNNIVHDVTGNDGITLHSAEPGELGSTHLITGNSCYNCREQGFDITSGRDITLRSNQSWANGHSGIVIAHNVTNVWIDKHTSRDETGRGIYILDSSSVKLTSSIVCNSGGQSLDISNCVNFEAYNNTVIHSSTNRPFLLDISGTVRNMTFKNNVFASLQASTPSVFVRYLFGTTPASVQSSFDQNLYWRPNLTSGANMFSDDSMGSYNFVTWQYKYGLDDGSLINDPQLIKPSSQDYHIQSSSVCVNRGVDVGLFSDFERTAIPQMGIPDIGAFEYEASASPQLRVVIEANPTSGQAPLNVNFTGSATGGTAPYTYSWNFGDDQASTSQNPFHSYPSEGAYTATLTVTDNEGGNAVASQVITVTKTAVSLAAAMSATPTSGQAPLNVNFSDSVSGGTAP